VDIGRKRISLTLRLDDDGQRPAGDGDRGSPRRTASPRSPRTAGGAAEPSRGDSRRGKPQAPAPDGAMADALRRAGLLGKEKRGR
jgi:uncharacterized protein